MFTNRISIYSGTKAALIGMLVLYSAVLSVVSVQMKPRTLLIGIDGRNTRVITQDTDVLLQAEKINFVLAFIEGYYGYDEKSYSEKAKDIKRRMSPVLWKKKKEEFDGIERKVKNEGLRQSYEILSFREIDKATYSADLKIRGERRGSITEFPLRVEIKLKKRDRDQEIPYGIEVEVLDEKRMG